MLIQHLEIASLKDDGVRFHPFLLFFPPSPCFQACAFVIVARCRHSVIEHMVNHSSAAAKWPMSHSCEDADFMEMVGSKWKNIDFSSV